MSLKTPEEESATPIPVTPTTDIKTDTEETNSGSEHNMETVRVDYDQLCSELNMDESTMDTAWKSYIAIRHNYTLEVNLNWKKPTLIKKDQALKGLEIYLLEIKRKLIE